MSKSVKRGQVWFYKPSAVPTGSVQRGPRPVIIVSNDVLNRTSPVVLGVPCTTQIKRNFPTHALFIMNRRVSVALAEQVTPIPVDDLTTLEYTLEDYVMKQVDAAIHCALALDCDAAPVAPSKLAASEIPVDNSVESVDKVPSRSQVDKFYSRYPQLSKPQKSRPYRWTPEKAQKLVEDFQSNLTPDELQRKYALCYRTLRSYYYKFKDGTK